jgi:hypothetical protein
VNKTGRILLSGQGLPLQLEEVENKTQVSSIISKDNISFSLNKLCFYSLNIVSLLMVYIALIAGKICDNHNTYSLIMSNNRVYNSGIYHTSKWHLLANLKPKFIL